MNVLEQFNSYAQRIGLLPQDIKYIEELINQAWEEGYCYLENQKVKEQIKEYKNKEKAKGFSEELLKRASKPNHDYVIRNNPPPPKPAPQNVTRWEGCVDA